jgi:hypothetical protein
MQPTDSQTRSIAGVLGAALLLCVFGGCAEKHVPRTDYLPLRDGNRWEYRLLDRPLLKRMAEGQAIVTAPLDEFADAGLNRDDSDLGDYAGAKAEVAPLQKDEAAAEEGTSGRSAIARRVALEMRAAVDPLTYRAVYDTAEQVWSKRDGYIGFQSARGRSYLLILPPHTSYKWVVSGPGGQDLFFEIENASATVSTPAGEFRGCALARQESRDRKEIFRYWFAPDVGLVRRSKFFMGEEVFRQELVHYIVKPATPATRLAEDREVKRAVEGKSRGSEFRAKSALEERSDRFDTRTVDELDEKIHKFSDPK